MIWLTLLALHVALVALTLSILALLAARPLALGQTARRGCPSSAAPVDAGPSPASASDPDPDSDPEPEPAVPMSTAFQFWLMGGAITEHDDDPPGPDMRAARLLIAQSTLATTYRLPAKA